MKSVCAKWIVAHFLAASISSFALSPAACAGSAAHGNLASDGRAQLSRGNAAYARGDHAEAFRLYRNIAVLGIPEAHYRLGLMYKDGVGTRKSVRQAEYWLKLAAEENHPGAAAALSSIGAMEEHG